MPSRSSYDIDIDGLGFNGQNSGLAVDPINGNSQRNSTTVCN
jgi:hypothetical protein